MRVNPHNPIGSLTANQAATKSRTDRQAGEPCSKPGTGVTTTANQLPAIKPLQIDLTTLASESASSEKPADIDAVPSKPFEFPAGVTLNELMKHWGEGDSKYDFTQDGQVNVDDLLMMINNWQSSFAGPASEPLTNPANDPADESVPAPATPISISEPTPAAPPVDLPTESIDALPVAADLTATASPSEPAPSTAPTDPNEPNTRTPPTLTGLMNAWGQNNSTYDFNVDGTVNVDDLLMMINNWPGNEGLSPEFSQDAFENAEPPKRGVHSASANGKLQKLAEQISTRLTSEGFGDQPPVNLRELVAQLNLSPKQTDFMMKQMQAKYPKGLGVSVVA